jgi:hypothetical protein
MSWLERSRAHIVHTPKSACENTLAGEPTVDAVTESTESSFEDRVAEEDSDVLRCLPTITPGRAGRYSVTDETGRQVGVIYGDYVVGFTVSCWSLHGRYADMDAVMTALAREAKSRAAAGLAAAS